MAMCIKTGACVRIEEYGAYLVCDVYEMNDEDGCSTLIFYAISEPEWIQSRPVTHRVHIGRGWFKKSGDETTIVVNSKNVEVV